MWADYWRLEPWNRFLDYHSPFSVAEAKLSVFCRDEECKMPLAPPVVFAALQATRATGPSSFLGPAYDQLILAVSNAISAWAVGQPSNLALTGMATGISGVGT